MNRIDGIDALAASYDIVIVGAGPAGMCAASTAARHGATTLVIDENPGPGGQIYRAITTTPVRDPKILGPDYWRGKQIADDFASSGAAYMPAATVWSINGEAPTFDIGISHGGNTTTIGARHLILATGAIERPFPIPGWTLPGVLTAGAAQIALKSAGLVPQGRVVLAGCGPLLYLLATQLHDAGADIAALVDTTPGANWPRALPFLPGLLLSPYIAKGMELMRRARKLFRSITGVTALAIEGDDRARRLLITQGSASFPLDCDLVLLHHGVIPNINISNAIGCAHHFHSEQHCWAPTVDAWFQSSLPGIAIAGDGGGIGGADSAAPSGTLATLEALTRLGRITHSTRDREATAPWQALQKSLRGRRFLDRLYCPSRNFLAPASPNTIACRCEEVTAGEIRETVRRLDVVGPNQLKAFLRCGMGPCQGRMCGPTVAELMSEIRNVGLAEIGTYHLRPPFKPITVAEYAKLPKTDAALKAVNRW